MSILKLNARLLLCSAVVVSLAGCSGMSIPGLPGASGAAAQGAAATAASDQSSQSSNASKKAATDTATAEPLTDKYCDSLAESYEVTTSVVKAAQAVAPAAGVQILLGGKIDTEQTMRDVSKKYVWIPVQVEQSIGKRLYDEQKAKGIVLERNAINRNKYYDKADAAFQAAKQGYKTPFELQLFIVQRDSVNAEALPGGYVMLDSGAATELSEDALRLNLGHEIAHSAKRHNSKQLQQRMIDIGVAQQMFDKLMKGGNPNDFAKLVGDDNVIKKFGGNFAAYQRDQELQADACSIRQMVRAHLDPQKARVEYLSVRTTEVKNSSGSTQTTTITAWTGDFSTHPSDATRDAFFAEATRHHQQALAAK